MNTQLSIIFCLLTLLLIISCKEEDTCNDGFLNGDETAIDCGGSCDDCYPCYDGIQNNGETDIDCGGSCEPCSNEWQVIYESMDDSIHTWDFDDDGLVGIIANTTTFLRITTDGGETWTDLPRSNTWSRIEKIYVINQNTWIVQPENSPFALTRNAGQEWTTGEFQVVKADFMSNNRGVFQLHNIPNNYDALYTTDNAVNSWSYLTSVNNFSGEIQQILRSSNDKVNIITNQKMYERSVHSSNTLKTMNLPNNLNGENITFRNSNGFALLHTNPMQMIQTFDQGISWNLTNDNIDINPEKIAAVDVYNGKFIVNTHESIASINNNVSDGNQFTRGFYSDDNGVTLQSLGVINQNNPYYSISCDVIGDNCFCNTGFAIIKLDLSTL